MAPENIFESVGFALNRVDFTPSMVIDVGAFEGEFSQVVRKVWSDVPICMVEALPDKKQILTEVCNKINACAIIAVVGEETRPVEFTVMNNGSSVYPELTKLPRTSQTMQMYTLDSLFSKLPDKNILLKLDVQGYELQVLKGASEILKRTEMIAVEASLIEYNKGAPLLHELLAEMEKLGFVTFDILGDFRRDSDGAIFQVDLLMVRKESKLREHNYFWNSELNI